MLSFVAQEKQKSDYVELGVEEISASNKPTFKLQGPKVRPLCRCERKCWHFVARATLAICNAVFASSKPWH